MSLIGDLQSEFNENWPYDSSEDQAARNQCLGTIQYCADYVAEGHAKIYELSEMISNVNSYASEAGHPNCIPITMARSLILAEFHTKMKEFMTDAFSENWVGTEPTGPSNALYTAILSY